MPETMTCPGCGEQLTLDWADGWRNDRGFTCIPLNTVHSDHIPSRPWTDVGVLNGEIRQELGR